MRQLSKSTGFLTAYFAAIILSYKRRFVKPRAQKKKFTSRPFYGIVIHARTRSIGMGAADKEQIP